MIALETDIYQQYGIDYSSGLKRFLNDKELYDSVLQAFLSDVNLNKAKTAYESKNMKALKLCIHELKGASGNAGMTNLYSACSELTLILKENNYTEGVIQDSYTKFVNAYNTTQEGVRIAMGENNGK